VTDNVQNDIYVLFNDMEQNIDQYDNVYVTKKEVARWHNNFRKRIGKNEQKHFLKWVVAACLAVAVVIFAGPFNDYSKAAIESVAYNLGEVLGFNKDIASYETMVGKNVVKDGYTVTLNSVILDGNVLYLTYTEQFPEKLEGFDKIVAPNGINTMMTGTINGTHHCLSMGGTYRPIDDYTRLAVFDITFENDLAEKVDFGKPVDVKLRYDVFAKNEKKPFLTFKDFKFRTDASKIALVTETTPLDYSYNLPDGSTIHFTKFEQTPVSRKIYYEAEGIKDGYFWELRLTDDMGNTIWETESDYTANDKDGGKTGQGFIHYNAGGEDVTNADATKLVATVWGGKVDEAKEDEDFMEQIGEPFTISLK